MNKLTRKLNSLTIVAPFYNEALGAEKFYMELVAQLRDKPFTFDMVFVDDGSHDETITVLNQLADQDNRITILSFSRNFGHQIALTAGLDYALGDVVVTMDSDLQHPPSHILDMIKKYEEGYDIVFGIRTNYENLSPLKKWTSEIYYALLEHVANINTVPGAADFRLMSRSAVKSLQSMREQHRYLRGMTPWVGFKSTYINYNQADRFAGVPSYSWLKSLKLASDGFFSFSTIPLQLIIWLGIIFLFLSFIYFVYVLFIAFSGQALPGWASVIILILTVSGTQLISLGVIAQYIGMIFEEVKDRPLYILQQKRLSNLVANSEDKS